VKSSNPSLQQKHRIISSGLFLDEELKDLRELTYQKFHYSLDDVNILRGRSSDYYYTVETIKRNIISIISKEIRLYGEYAINIMGGMEGLPDARISLLTQNLAMDLSTSTLVALARMVNSFELDINESANQPLETALHRMSTIVPADQFEHCCLLDRANRRVHLKAHLHLDSSLLSFYDDANEESVWDLGIPKIAFSLEQNSCDLEGDLMLEKIDLHVREYSERLGNSIAMDTLLITSLPSRALFKLATPRVHECQKFYADADQFLQAHLSSIRIYLLERPLKNALEHILECYQKILPIFEEYEKQKFEKSGSIEVHHLSPPKPDQLAVNVHVDLIDTVMLKERESTIVFHLIDPLFSLNVRPDRLRAETSIGEVALWEIDDEDNRQVILGQKQKKFADYTLDMIAMKDSDHREIDINGFVSHLILLIRLKVVEKIMSFVGQVSSSCRLEGSKRAKSLSAKETRSFMQDLAIRANSDIGTIQLAALLEEDRSQSLMLRIGSIKLFTQRESRLRLEANDVAMLTTDSYQDDHSLPCYVVDKWNLGCTLMKMQNPEMALFEVRAFSNGRSRIIQPALTSSRFMSMPHISTSKSRRIRLSSVVVSSQPCRMI
jgi:hypothetical protein